MDKNPLPESSPDRWVTVRRPPTAMKKRSNKLSRECSPSTAVPNRSSGLASGDWWSDDGPPDSPPPPKPRPVSINPCRYGNLRNPDKSGTSSIVRDAGSPPEVPVHTGPSPSLPSPPPSTGPACVRGLPKKWHSRLKWELPFYPTEEEWAEAERETRMHMRAYGVEVSSSSDED